MKITFLAFMSFWILACSAASPAREEKRPLTSETTSSSSSSSGSEAASGSSSSSSGEGGTSASSASSASASSTGGTGGSASASSSSSSSSSSASSTGGPLELASGQSAPCGIAVDASYVYWTNAGDSTVSRAPLAGGPTEVLGKGPSAAAGPAPLALGGGSVVWANAAGFLAQVPVSGGTTQILSNPGDTGITTLVADENAFYFNVTPASGFQNTSVERLSFAGAQTDVWADCGSSIPSIAVDSKNVYVVEAGGEGIVQFQIDGSQHAVDADDNVGISAVAVASGWVYWTQYDTTKLPAQGTLRRVPAGGAVNQLDGTVMATTGNSPSAIVADASNVYWADQYEIHKFDVQSETSLVFNGTAACGMALDSVRLYWTTLDGRVLSAPR